MLKDLDRRKKIKVASLMNSSAIGKQAAAGGGGGRASKTSVSTATGHGKKKLHLHPVMSESGDSTPKKSFPTRIPTTRTASSSSSSLPCSSSSSSRSCSCGLMTQMNPDTLISILQLLPVESIVSFSSTCRKLRSLASSDTLWESICRRDWGAAAVAAIMLEKSRTTLWKTVYQNISHVGSVSCSRLSSKDGAFPQPRASHSVNSVSGYLVLFGGGCEGGRHLDDAWVSYIGNGAPRTMVSWRPLRSDRPSGRFGHTCTLVDNILVLFGGISENGIRQNDTWFGKVSVENGMISLTWELLLSMTAPPPRGAHACCSVGDDKVLIHGGIGLDGVRLDDLWLLDLSGGLSCARWQRIINAAAPSPAARSGHTLTWIGGTNVVLFGGRGVGYEVQNDVWILGMESLLWVEMIFSSNCPETPLPRVGHSATTVLGGRVLVYGGEDSQRHRKDDFWLLDIRGGRRKWKRLMVEQGQQQQPESRSFHRACAADGSGRRIYIFGGMVDGLLHPAEAFGLRFDGSLYLVELAIQL